MPEPAYPSSRLPDFSTTTSTLRLMTGLTSEARVPSVPMMRTASLTALMEIMTCLTHESRDLVK